MRFWGLKTCDTCKKALKALHAQGEKIEVIDVRSDQLLKSDLLSMIEAFGDKTLNKASTTWRQLDEAQKDRPIIELLQEHPTLLKRPVIDTAGFWTQGWTKSVQEIRIHKV